MLWLGWVLCLMMSAAAEWLTRRVWTLADPIPHVHTHTHTHMAPQLRSITMTCCDLAAMYKPWASCLDTADHVYEEFFLQGDEEMRMGLPFSAELMDRKKLPEIPRMQVDFYNFIGGWCW